METIMRLSKIMAQRGLCSRREADTYIEKGWVVVDGKVVSELGTKVSSDANIELDERAHNAQRQKNTDFYKKKSITNPPSTA